MSAQTPGSQPTPIRQIDFSDAVQQQIAAAAMIVEAAKQRVVSLADSIDGYDRSERDVELAARVARAQIGTARAEAQGALAPLAEALRLTEESATPTPPQGIPVVPTIAATPRPSATPPVDEFPTTVTFPDGMVITRKHQAKLPDGTITWFYEPAAQPNGSNELREMIVDGRVYTPERHILSKGTDREVPAMWYYVSRPAAPAVAAPATQQLPPWQQQGQHQRTRRFDPVTLVGWIVGLFVGLVVASALNTPLGQIVPASVGAGWHTIIVLVTQGLIVWLLGALGGNIADRLVPEQAHQSSTSH